MAEQYTAEQLQAMFPNLGNAIEGYDPEAAANTLNEYNAGTLGINFTQTAPDQYQWLPDDNVSGDSTAPAPTYDLYNSILSSATDSATNKQVGRENTVNNIIDSYRTGQGRLDERGVQNSLSRQQGYQGVLDLVNQGLTSGNNLLSNRNASNSSAYDALGRAYARFGQQQLAGSLNQFNAENRAIGFDQKDLAGQLRTQKEDYETQKQQFVNNLILEVQSQIDQLRASSLGADVPTQIQIEQDIADLRSQALTILSQADQRLNTDTAAIQPTTAEQNRQTAAGLVGSGTARNPFTYAQQVPVQFQGQGSSGNLPLFTLQSRRKED